LEFNVPFQHKYGYIRDEAEMFEDTAVLLHVVIHRVNFALQNGGKTAGIRYDMKKLRHCDPIPCEQEGNFWNCRS